ncbi:MAG: DUF2062 domain-containing protein [Armatimonadetes bacterium]|nr:DUF2062 domain-containing protein [Akkermansiaceae bacterium]
MSTAIDNLPQKSGKSRLNRWIIQPIKKQLTSGITPEKLSWTIALGITLGIFPIMGTTSALCLLFGFLLKLNQPILHLFKTLSYPLHLGLILVFIRLGQNLHGVPPIPFSIPEMMSRFKDSPTEFARDFGLAAWYGIQAWALAAIILIPALRHASLPLLRKLVRKKEAFA